ncbi:spore germination protein [Paenibacillus hamazuiensis]|uniref:spore germination protein n=1 Tax=Paenibacillus hamazuiensis TaxID=2936508 RepID=UPI00200C6F89|nr:spore germination protein [Paenibacillus hamazuiensis]
MPAVDERQLRDSFARAEDVAIAEFRFESPSAPVRVLLLYSEGLADTKQIDQSVLPHLKTMLRETERIDESALLTGMTLQLQPVSGPDELGTVTKRVFSGELVLFFEEAGLLYSVDISNPPNRQPEESSSESSIKGPRDSFTENVATNVALIRKRMKTRSLCCEKFEIGERSRTSVALLYLADVARPDVIEEARGRLRSLKVDGLLSSGQLEEGLSGKKISLFPLLDYTGRPEYVADCLLRGRFAVLVDGSPMAVIAPANLMLTLKSAEDVHFPFYYVSMERLLRFAGLIVSTFLPGFWLALIAYNVDQLPFPLVATISSSRLGLPLSGPMDFILMLLLFELFREAGMRLPKAVGQTVTVVGGLIVGDAAIRAGITSPTTLVITSISTISMFTVVNQTLAGTVSVLRVAILLVSGFLGIYGFMLCMIGLALYLSTLESFGVPYMAPLSPPKFREIPGALLAKPWKTAKRRPFFLKTRDKTRRGGGSA